MHAKGGTVRRELNSPRQVAFDAKTTAVHQAAQAAQRVAKRDARGKGVGDLPKRLLAVETGVKNHRQHRADEAAVKHQPTAPKIEHLPERFAGILVIPVSEHVHCPGTKHPGDDNPHAEIGDDFAVEFVEDAPAAGGPKPGHKTTGDEDAVPVDCEAADLEGNGVHFAAQRMVLVTTV